MLKISKAKQEKLIETQQSLSSKSEEVSSNETSLLAIVGSKFKEIQSKLNKHRQQIEKLIQKQCNAEKEKVNVILKENVKFQEGLKESVSFCENILSNSSDLEVVYFFDDMKSSLLKCSNPGEKEYQGSLQRLEINVKYEISEPLNVVETFVDDKANVKVGVRSSTLSVVDKETNTVSEDETCIEKGNVKTKESKTLAEKKDTKTASMISASQDRSSIEGRSKDTQERKSVKTSESKSQSTPSTDNAQCLTAFVPKCLKTYDLSDVSNENERCYTSVTWIGKTSFAIADEQNQTAIIISNVHGNTIVRSHSVKGIVAIASFNDYLACKTQSGDIFIYSYPEWNLKRTFKGAYALSSRSSELIWVTKEKIMIFENNYFEEKSITDEDGKPFVFRRPFQFCCLPNKSFAITDKVLDCLYILDQSGHISTRIEQPKHMRALSCDKDNRIYMTCYETNSICILDTNGTCSLKCILNKPRTISVRSAEAILVTNKNEVVLLSLM